ncbi:hypothetical protein GCM10022252_12840 [Streptosporangium oxazolinicum]|uniref:Uncharacterized protein n=1 Tax=Streptosporangium oxazolinicum TaxID=909287 RepID=A0ABP8AHV4_9ACTN
MTVSAAEWAASDSIADEPLNSPATSLATAIARLARPATITVERLSEPPPSASVPFSVISGMRLLYVHLIPYLPVMAPQIPPGHRGGTRGGETYGFRHVATPLP